MTFSRRCGFAVMLLLSSSGLAAAGHAHFQASDDFVLTGAQEDLIWQRMGRNTPADDGGTPCGCKPSMFSSVPSSVALHMLPEAVTAQIPMLQTLSIRDAGQAAVDRQSRRQEDRRHHQPVEDRRRRRARSRAIPLPELSAVRGAGRRAPRATSIRAGKTPHGEFDAIAGQHPPGFDLGHVGGLGKPAEHLTRLLARGLARQRKGLAPERVARAHVAGERFRRASGDVGRTAGGVRDDASSPQCSAKQRDGRVARRLTPEHAARTGCLNSAAQGAGHAASGVAPG